MYGEHDVDDDDDDDGGITIIIFTASIVQGMEQLEPWHCSLHKRREEQEEKEKVEIKEEITKCGAVVHIFLREKGNEIDFPPTKK